MFCSILQHKNEKFSDTSWVSSKVCKKHMHEQDWRADTCECRSEWHLYMCRTGGQTRMSRTEGHKPLCHSSGADRPQMSTPSCQDKRAVSHPTPWHDTTFSSPQQRILEQSRGKKFHIQHHATTTYLCSQSHVAPEHHVDPLLPHTNIQMSHCHTDTISPNMDVANMELSHSPYHVVITITLSYFHHDDSIISLTCCISCSPCTHRIVKLFGKNRIFSHNLERTQKFQPTLSQTSIHEYPLLQSNHKEFLYSEHHTKFLDIWSITQNLRSSRNHTNFLQTQSITTISICKAWHEYSQYSEHHTESPTVKESQKDTKHPKHHHNLRHSEQRTPQCWEHDAIYFNNLSITKYSWRSKDDTKDQNQKQNTRTPDLQRITWSPQHSQHHTRVSTSRSHRIFNTHRITEQAIQDTSYDFPYC